MTGLPREVVTAAGTSRGGGNRWLDVGCFEYGSRFRHRSDEWGAPRRRGDGGEFNGGFACRIRRLGAAHAAAESARVVGLLGCSRESRERLQRESVENEKGREENEVGRVAFGLYIGPK